MRVPTPQEIGLPPKFDTWRANQAEALRVMITSQKRITALSAPTGFGKSPVYVAHAIYSGKPTCIVTNSRGLQDQLMRDFECIGMVDIRGRANYQCEMRDDFTCEDGFASRCPYRGSVGCPATLAEMNAASSKLVVTNYAKWTASHKFGMGMEHFEQVILDEGHDAPDAVAQAMQVILNYHEIEDRLEFPFPRTNDDTFATWKAWAAGARYEAEKAMQECRLKIDEHVNPRPTWVKDYLHMKNLCKRLATLSTARAQDWVVDRVEGGYQFDPIRPAVYTEGTLFLRIPRIILVSATLRPKTLFMLGVSKDKFDFYEFDSDFDRDRCPIYWVPTMRVDIRSSDLGMLWARLDQIISKRRDRKGIIHTISYARRDDIVNRSRFASSMLINPKGEPATSMVEQFKASPPGTILVSPSVGTGYDFPGNTCEWQFVCKIPFPDGRSKIIKARQEDDNEYGAYHAMQTLVQAFGRGMRSKEDRCENFIGDDHLSWFLPRYGHLAPRTFHSFFSKVSVLPQPPEAL